MIKRGIIVFLLGNGVFFCTFLCLSLQTETVHASETMYASVVVALPSATATLSVKSTPAANLVTMPTSSKQSNSKAINWSDTAIIVAIIGAVAIIIAAVIGVVGSLIPRLFDAFKERKKERREEQARKDAETEAAREQQKRLQEQKDAVDEHVRVYKERLRQDPTIAAIKILDMSRPVEVANVYVQLKLRQDARTNATGTLMALQKELDPNVFLEIDRKRIEENYALQAIDPTQAIHDNKQCVILGDPGSGKTTLLKYLTVQALDKQLTGLPDLPVYVELSRFAESGHESLVEFVAERWERFYGFPQVEARTYIELQLEVGNVFLLLDALDEGAIGKGEDERETSYRRTFDAITQVTTRYPKAYVVVTARIAGYRQRAPLAAFTELEVLGFRLEDIHTFVSKWFGSLDEQRIQQGRDLNAQLKDNIRAHTLATNPLLLSLIVLLYEQHERLPEHRAELYKQCVNMLLYEWDKKHKSIQRFSGLSIDYKRRMLEEVAWYFHGRHERYFQVELLLTLIGHFLPGAGLKADQKEQVLEEISADTGLLKKQAEGWYGFLHLTFQEYFVAHYAVDKGLLDELLKHRGEPWWEEVILLYAGSTIEMKPLVEQLLALEDDIFETNVLLAGRCLAVNANMDQEVAPFLKQIVTRLFDILKDTFYDVNKKRAASVLAELGPTDEGIDTHLLQILAEKSSAREVKKAITSALGTYGERTLVRRLLPMLFDTNLLEITRAGIASIIGNLGDSSLVDTLLPKLQDKGTDDSIREHIVPIVVRLGDRSLSAKLLPLLLNDNENINVRTQIAFGWSEIGDPKDAPRLAAKLVEPQMSEQTIYTIPFALAAFQSDHSVVPSLLKFASNAQGVFTRNFIVIANILSRLRNPTVTSEIMSLIADRQVDLFIRKDLVASLVDIAHRSAIPELQHIYADTNTEQELKEEIAHTLYVLGDRTIPVDTDKIVTDASRMGPFEQYILDQMEVSKQLQLLEDAHTNVMMRQYIAARLANSTNTSIVPPLCKLAINRVVNLKVRKGVIDTLGKIADDRETVEALVQLVNSDQQVRDEAVEALWYVSRRARIRVVANEMTRLIVIE